MIRVLGMMGMAGWLATASSGAWGAARSASGEKFFEMEVRPLLAQHCFKCHGDKKQKSDLRLDTHTSLLKGGKRGAVVEPGQPDKSRLIEAVTRRNKDLQMPPDDPLSEQQVDTLRRWVEMGAPWPAGLVLTHEHEKVTITDAERKFWSFVPLADPQPPAVKNTGWVRTAVDRFILAKLEEQGIDPAPAADKRVLIRRVYLDLIGLPPTPAQIDAFVHDASPDALEKVVDELLASPHYGERWAQHWLDLIRYADSDGYKEDAYRPKSWHYRDWVIRAFNQDMPYDQFVRLQLAGDELAPDDPQALIATGYLRLWPYEYNNRDARGQWNSILDDTTENAGDVFLGLSMGCARCHDHKYDPIPQADYYRLRAFFAPMLPDESILAATPAQRRDYQAALEQWEQKAAGPLKVIRDIEAPQYERAAKSSITKFPPDVRDILLADPATLSPLDQQVRDLAYRQVVDGEDKVKLKIDEKHKAAYEQAKQELAELEKVKPQPPTPIMAVRDVGPVAPPTHIPDEPTGRDVAPGFLSVIDPAPAKIIAPTTGVNSTGRRSTLAAWLTRPDNALALRVIVNRVWHYHFGRGITGTPNDLGKVGDRPSHPELLDWLARRFVADGWSFKKLHKLIVTSNVYRQSSVAPASDAAMRADPQNHLLWRMRLRRLDSEQIRDVMLTASGELDRKVGGPGVDTNTPRRSIYLKVLRNNRDPIRDAFDAPDGFVSSAVRNHTTTAPQALLMINSQWTFNRAGKLADQLLGQFGGANDPAIAAAFEHLYGRPPTEEETTRARLFIQCQEKLLPAEARNPTRTVMADFCHALMNTNPMLYID